MVRDSKRRLASICKNNWKLKPHSPFTISHVITHLCPVCPLTLTADCCIAVTCQLPYLVACTGFLLGSESLCLGVTEWWSDWVMEWLSDSLSDSLTQWLTDSVTHWLSDSLTQWLTEWWITRLICQARQSPIFIASTRLSCFQFHAMGKSSSSSSSSSDSSDDEMKRYQKQQRKALRRQRKLVSEHPLNRHNSLHLGSTACLCVCLSVRPQA